MNTSAHSASEAVPAFSIITASFNAAQLFPRTSASLAAQTYRSFEWLVIDGGSSDRTVDLISAAGELVTWWISERDKGIADAWNKGIVRARGDYVLLLNAGDTYDPCFLESIRPLCDGQRIVCSHARVSAADGTTLRIFRAQPDKLQIAMHVPHNWCAVPRHHYSSLGLYKHLPLAMDFEWFHRYYNRYGARGFVVCDEVLGTYYLGGASDARYVESFRTNERILIDNGMHPLRARAYMFAYRMKHALKHRLAWSSHPSVK